ncbi:MAG: hypothetical protein HFH08_04455 [Bacilli bacterium]|nr:hypothetical protein [Bacilli bacterium]
MKFLITKNPMGINQIENDSYVSQIKNIHIIFRKVLKMIVADLFEQTIFPNLKKYVELNSNALVSKKKEDSYPLVVVKLLPIKNQYSSLNYEEEVYIFGIDIKIFSDEDITLITNKVIEYFRINFRLTLRLELDVSESIYQNNIRITGKINAKSNIVYPFEDYQE